MTTPLISIMMPCYNAANTLPLALTSLIAQTYPNWECILIDDGSLDKPELVVQQISDTRIKFLRFEKNRGRGVARQEALNRACGDYLCMLDADDWYYPTKLEKQVAVMENYPDLALVSCGMAIVDHGNRLVGIRSYGPKDSTPIIYGPLTKLMMPPVAHAPSMIRMPIAKQIKYDQSFLLAQDVDYLINVLLDRYYCILPDISYVYSEISTVTLQKVISASIYTRKMFWKHRKRFPMASYVRIIEVLAKETIYKIAFSIRQGNWLIERRSKTPCITDYEDFSQAHELVAKLMANYSSFSQTSGVSS